mgnify:CR=1 FL=1
MPTNKEIDAKKSNVEKKLRWIKVILSQENFDNACYGYIVRPEKYNNLLKEHAELQREYTKEWQIASGYLRNDEEAH